MKSIYGNILAASKGEHAQGVLYAGAVGLLLSDVIPTPADALYFYTEKRLRDKWKNNEITPEKYWTRSASAYYLYNPVWWGLVLAALYFTKGDVKDKAKIGLAIVGAGAVVGVIYRNYTKDIQEIKKETLKAQEPKVEFTGGSKSKSPIKNVKPKQGLRKGNILKFVG